MARRKYRRAQKPATRIGEMRANLGLSPAGLARAAGVSESQMRSIERDGVVPRAETQMRVARVFGVAPTELWPLAEADDEAELAA